ncbi:MFS transporter [Methylobacterium sp. SI9]|uniref:MFS transporter n=1 Tax=Methylobacterium guangdongense TaxID=3138811 RepID=UPI00313D99F1
MALASNPTASIASASPGEARRTLAVTGVNHALHDGYTDLIYVLLPVWQAEFGLDYVALALLRSLYNGALAALQMPASRLAQSLGARTVLMLGTLLSALGYAVAGASGGLIGLGIGLLVGGAGSSTQHPLASAVIARAYGSGARGPLGTYNFTGDLGKAAVPPLVGFLLTLTGWRHALWVVAGAGLVVALAVGRLLPRDRASRTADPGAAPRAPVRAVGAPAGRGGFRLLVAIGMLDNAARPAFLIYLPFLMQEKGAALTTVGLALSLVFVGGALGKAVCGRIGERLGVTRTVILTETGTAVMILAVIALPLAPALLLLPLLGVMLNGTSSVLYGTVPELAPGGQVERAFAVFYTWTLGGSALAAPLLYGRLGDMAGPHWAAAASAATALAAVPLMLALAPSLRGETARRPT